MSKDQSQHPAEVRKRRLEVITGYLKSEKIPEAERAEKIMVYAIRTWGVSKQVAKDYAFVVVNKSTCCVCGRTLTNPDSISLGIGPICAARILSTEQGSEGIYVMQNRRLLTEDDLIGLAAPVIESQVEFKALRTRLLNNQLYRRVISIKRKTRTPPPGYPTLLRWMEDEI
jgi:hypothetical protein